MRYFENWIFSIHDAVKIGTFGSESQAGTDTASSFNLAHALSMDIKKDFAYRLNLLFSAEGVPEKYRGRMEDLSKEFLVTPKTISNWLNGIKMPQLETIMLIALRHNCNAEWLLTGRGPMRPEQNPIKLDDAEKDLVKTYRELRPEDQKKLFQVAEVFKPIHNDTAI